MLRSSYHLLFSMALILSMLAPPIFTLLQVNEDAIAMMDTSEEEKNEKMEKDAEEKILQFDELFTRNSEAIPRKSLSTFYLDRDCSYSQDILLPPPKHTL